MWKPTVLLVLLPLATAGSKPEALRPTVLFEEAHLVLEYAAGDDEAIVIVRAETESHLDLLELRDPAGESVMRLGLQGGRGLALSALTLDTRETTLAHLVAAFPEGPYDLRGREVTGGLVLGTARLSHALLPAPLVSSPKEGALVEPAEELVVSWTADPTAVGYEVRVEQDANEGLTVGLGAGAHAYRVPQGCLAPGQDTRVEVIAIARNGNRTITEVGFRTR